MVVTIPEPNPFSWSMPPAELHESTHVIGGMRTLHELAVALAATGREVELRGPVSRPVFEGLAEAADARPQLPRERRRPRAGEIVVNIEGEHDPLRFARYLLSPARLVVAMLAPSGQFGWPFVSPWEPQSPLTIDPKEVGRSEHLRAIAALGIDIWTHMPPIQRLAGEVGARCSFIGSGEPNPVSAAQTAKDIPVVYLQANRWWPLAEAVARRIHAPVTAIPEGDHDTVMGELARARVMLWPCRVEGDGRLLREARARGTVVVGLSSNIYAVGLDESSGALAVDGLGEMPRVVEHLLSDPVRLDALAEAGRSSAREQVNWSRYLQRVDMAAAAIEARPDDAAASARAGFGDRFGELLEERERAVERVDVLDAHLAEAAARLHELDGALEAARVAAPDLAAAATKSLSPSRRTARRLRALASTSLARRSL